MANKYHDEQEKLREKRELLKLKQGIIDDSEVIEEYEISHDYKQPEGASKKIENFFYHYKWHVIAIAFIVFFVGFMIIHTVTQEKNDLYVLAISTSNESNIYVKQVDIERALEQYCPDFDGNGYVHVGVNFMNVAENGAMMDYTGAETMKFHAELFTGDSQMYLTDDGIIDVINTIGKGEIDFFTVFTDEYPDATLYEGQGLQLNTTDFVDAARWTDCADIVGLYVRDEFEHQTGDPEEIAEQRARALEVFHNIVTGNVVNPPAED